MMIAAQKSTEHVGEWTVLRLLDWSTKYLVEQGFDEARLHVELLLGSVLRLSRVDLYLQFDRPLTTDELASFKAHFQRRLRHEPLQYILGSTEFMGLKFDVSPDVWIPRPETEILVEQAIELLKSEGNPRWRILDIGVGSGNIAASVAHYSPAVQVTGLDINQRTLKVARGNAARHADGRVELVDFDIMHGTPPGSPFDMVLSNPPYIPAAEMPELAPEIREFEPRRAATDEGDGLSCYRRIFSMSPDLLRPGGWLLLEIGYGQRDAVNAMAASETLECFEFVNDLANIPRVFRARRKR